MNTRREELIEKKPLSDSIASKLDQLLGNRTHLRVLEAGCGSASHVVLPSDIFMAGIDISGEQLAKNKTIQEKILGDLQTYSLPANDFDIVICWDVIEHLKDPVSALSNIFKSTKKGGVVVLAFPNVMSFKGLVTKFSPHWVHRSYYRMLNYSSTPFKTFLRFSIRPSNVARLATLQGLSVEMSILYDGIPPGFKRRRVLYGIVKAVIGALNAMTLFRYDLGQSDCVFIFKKI